METSICLDCKDPIINYNRIIRHVIFINGFQIYSKTCQRSNCECKQPRIDIYKTDKIEEVDKWRNAINNAMKA